MKIKVPRKKKKEYTKKHIRIAVDYALGRMVGRHNLPCTKADRDEIYRYALGVINTLNF